MRIKLKDTLPLDSRHGATKDREFDVVRTNTRAGRKVYYMVGDAGEDFAAFTHEFAVIAADPQPVDTKEEEPVVQAVAEVPPVTDAEKIEKAAEAVEYVLERIRKEQRVYHVMGFGTQTFELLVDAYAALHEVSRERAQAYFSKETDQL